MKKLILLIMVFGFANQGWGQEQIEIKINPFGKDTIPQRIKKGSTVKVRISNVNTFKINGFTETKPLNISFEVPAIFTSLQPLPTQPDGEPKTKEDSSLKLLENLKKYSENWSQLIDNVTKQNITDKNKLDSLLKLVNKLKSEDSLIAKYKLEFKAFIANFQNIQQYTELEAKLANKLKDSIFIRNVDVLKDNAKSDYNTLYISTADAVMAKNRIVIAINDLQNNYTALEQLYNQLNKTLDKDSVAISGELKSAGGTTVLTVKDANVKQSRKKYFSEEMAFVKKTFEALTTVKNRNETIAKAQAGIDLYSQIIKSNFFAYTDAKQLNDDEVTLSPKLKFANGKTAYDFSDLTVKTYGGLKVNFSAGYLVSFIGDDNYNVYKNNSGVTVGVTEGNKNKITHALGGLVHVYPHLENSPEVGFSAGASLATNGNLGFYFGGSVFFLEKNRLVLTGGYSFLKVKKLNTANLVPLNNQYNFVSSTDTEIKYDDVYKGAWFIGVTYNLTK